MALDSSNSSNLDQLALKGLNVAESMLCCNNVMTVSYNMRSTNRGSALCS